MINAKTVKKKKKNMRNIIIGVLMIVIAATTILVLPNYLRNSSAKAYNTEIMEKKGIS